MCTSNNTYQALEGFFYGHRDIGQKLKGIQDIVVNIQRDTGYLDISLLSLLNYLFIYSFLKNEISDCTHNTTLIHVQRFPS